jgi:AcrR family transcriptional regulator
MHHEPSRLERKRDARTLAILDEAMAILAAEGLEALTLGRLARSLDVVPAALYRYFDSKDALLAALQRRAVGLIHERLRRAQSDLDEATRRSPPDVAVLVKLLGAAHLYLDLPRSAPQTFFLVALLMGDPRPLLSDEESRRTAPLLLAMIGDVEALFRTAVETRALARGDSIERTLAFWAVLQGALTLEKARRVAPALPSAAVVAGSAIATLLTGWGAPAAQLRRAQRIVESGKGARS